MENNQEEKATIKLIADSETFYTVRFKPIQDCSILMVASPEIMPTVNFDQKEILELIGNIRETAGYGMWVFDLALRKASWSDGMYQLLEIEKSAYEELVTSDEDLYHKFVEPADLPMIRENYKRIIDAGHDVDMVYGIITGKGKRKKVHTSIKVLEKNTNGVSKCIGINKDITAPSQLSELLLRQASEIALKEKMLLFGTWQYDLQTRELDGQTGSTGCLDMILMWKGEPSTSILILLPGMWKN
jgi:PAS domain-containing protein